MTPPMTFGEMVEESQSSLTGIASRLALDVTCALYERMLDIGMDQAMLAKKMGVKRAYVSKFFGGGENSTLLTIAKFMLALGMANLHIEIK